MQMPDMAATPLTEKNSSLFAMEHPPTEKDMRERKLLDFGFTILQRKPSPSPSKTRLAAATQSGRRTENPFTMSPVAPVRIISGNTTSTKRVIVKSRSIRTTASLPQPSQLMGKPSFTATFSTSTQSLLREKPAPRKSIFIIVQLLNIPRARPSLSAPLVTPLSPQPVSNGPSKQVVKFGLWTPYSRNPIN